MSHRECFPVNAGSGRNFMYKIFDNWDEDEEILNIADGFDHCFKDLGDKLTELCLILRFHMHDTA